MSEVNSGPTKSNDAGQEYRYWAFISYSHRDTNWAKRLHSHLETWKVPRSLVGHATPVGKIPRRLNPIFRDRDEMSGGGNLDEVILAALKTSRYLIVVCSPASSASQYVDEEIRMFKAMGREDRILYIILNGEPGSNAVCLPSWARRRVGVDGAETTVEPLAADARRGKDGYRNATLKILARLLDVEFDGLKRRDARRRRRLTTFFATSGCALAGAVVLGYIALADAGMNVPFADSVRTTIDRQDKSVFRPVPSLASIRAEARRDSQTLTKVLLEKRQSDGWINDMPPDQKPGVSIWSHVQGVVALLSTFDSDPSVNRKALQSLKALFKPGMQVTRGGINWGWMGHYADAGNSNGYMPLWTVIACGTALTHADADADPNLRPEMTRDLLSIQEILKPYHPYFQSGSWNGVPFEADPSVHSVYAATLALMALVELHRAGVPWDGSEHKRDTLLRQTAEWLISKYQSEGRAHGWVNDPHEEHAGDVLDGLTAETYCALLLAEQLSVGPKLSPQMLTDIHKYLVDCGSRKNDYAIDVGESRLTYRHVNGKISQDIFSIRYLWWPWVARCADLWLRTADTHSIPPEQRVDVRRTLAHMIIELGPEEIAKAPDGYSYVVSEKLWCLECIAAK